MKSYYDVVGSGEGISGLIACVLLSQKGFSCLWADTAHQVSGDSPQCSIPLLVTRVFWEHGVKPVFSAVGTSFLESLQPRTLEKVQSIVPGKRFDVGPGPVNGDLMLQQKNTVKYLQLLGKSMTRPGALLRAAQRAVPEVQPWEKDHITALCRTGKPNYLSYLRWMASLSGMYSLDYHAVKQKLGRYLPQNRGDFLHVGEADVIVENGRPSGLRVNSTQVKSRYFISDHSADEHARGGFVFYGTCVVDREVIPVGMGDMLVVSPPQDMRYPMVLLVDRKGDKGIVTVTTKVPADNVLTSRTELLSWAMGMIFKRLKQVIPYLKDYLIGFDVIDPFTDNSTRPWFKYADEVRVPWYVSAKRYMKQGNNVFTCNSMQYGWLDMEGEVLWGICMANAILMDLNRSDLITSRMARMTRV